MAHAVHTSDSRLFKRMWRDLGGRIVHIRGTGEAPYTPPHFERPVRANDRRQDVPAKLLSRRIAIARITTGIEQR